MEALARMEGFRNSGENTGSFWLEQYQRLLDSKSHQLVESLKSFDPDLVHEIFLHGVFHLLPLIVELINTTEDLEGLTPESLALVGSSLTDTAATAMFLKY